MEKINTKRPLVFFIFLFLFNIFSFAQTLEVSAPGVVEAGVSFRVEFKTNKKPQNFTPPDFGGFNVIAGPSISQGQSINIVNGQMSREESYTYTYVLQALEPGNLTIGEAEMVIDGKKYHSSSRIIEVVSASSGGTGAAQNNDNSQSAQSRSTLAGDDILLVATTNTSNVYKGQPLKVTYKLLTRVDIRGIDGLKLPALNNFWTQEIVHDNNWKQETYNNKVYESVIIKEYLLFPQQSGDLTVEPMSLTALAQIITQTRRQSIFDDFFGGGPSVQQVRKDIATQPLKITVKELPSGAPSGFSGAVGVFDITGGVSQKNIAVNESGNYIINITGSGNLPTITVPKVNMPSSFEQYSVRTEEKYNQQADNINGTKTYTIPFIARAEGNYTIDPVNFTFFNTRTERYETVTLPAVEMNVVGDGGNSPVSPGIISGNKEDLRILDNDIRYIKTGSPQLKLKRTFFIWSLAYFIIIFVLFCVFAVCLVYLRKRVEFMSNTKLVKNKRARKVALKRLKNAGKNLQIKNEQGFYDEMLKALWGYMSDKLDIPVAELSKDNIRRELDRRYIDPDLTEEYVNMISECEFARYAPVSEKSIGNVYNSAMDVISKLESKI